MEKLLTLKCDCCGGSGKHRTLVKGSGLPWDEDNVWSERDVPCGPCRGKGLVHIQEFLELEQEETYHDERSQGWHNR